MQRKRKSLLAIVFIIIFAVATLSACGGSSPQRLIRGSWDARNGDYIIFESGGRGRDCCGSFTYRVYSDNTLRITQGFDEISFRWADSGSDVGWNEWHVTRRTLYFMGETFTRR